MYSFNIILTELCNANCTHCYMSDDNKKIKKTMSKEDIDIIIDKLPKNTKTVVFTGGEIFLVSDLLYYAINKVREKFSDIEIGLETNGIIFYKDLNSLPSKLKELKNMGVSFIRFSLDPFHEAGGVDLDKVRQLKKYENDDTPTIKYLVQDKALGIGKAEKLTTEQIDIRNCMNSLKTVDNPYLFLDIDGNAYICTWKCLPKIGNLITDSWENIVINLSTEFNQLVLKGNIEEAIGILTKEDISKLKQESNDNGQCMLCYKKISR